jgi:hypothetical protein
MKKIINTAIAFLVVVSFSNCRKNEIIKYNEKPAVYFSTLNDNDSLVYSFIGKAVTTDTVYLDVKLLGDKLLSGKKYKVEVNDAMSNAKETVHYKKPDDFYTFPEGVFDTKLPVIIYNTDELLKTQSVLLTLTLKSTDELNTGYPTKINAHIVITNQLVKPSYWNGLLVIFYGAYSKVKHETCIQLQGHDFPTTQAEALAAPYGVAYWISYGRVAAKYFTDNIVNDENGNRILPWAAL